MFFITCENFHKKSEYKLRLVLSEEAHCFTLSLEFCKKGNKFNKTIITSNNSDMINSA